MFSTGFDPFSDGIKQRNYLIAFVSGTLTGIAWWILIDILVRSTETLFSRVYILPGLFVTIMILFLHFIPDAAIEDEKGLFNMFDSGSELCECGSIKCARFSLFAVFLIVFSCVVASIWIFIADYATSKHPTRKLDSVQWFGVGNIIFTILLTIAAILSRFGRKQTDSMAIY